MSLSCVSCLSSVNCELQLDLIESPLKSAGYKFVRVSTCMFLRLMPCDNACRRHHVHSADIFGQIRTQYDGSMNVNKRTAALTALNTDPRTTVMIVSTKCGALGLNLNVANRYV